MGKGEGGGGERGGGGAGVCFMAEIVWDMFGGVCGIMCVESFGNGGRVGR